LPPQETLVAQQEPESQTDLVAVTEEVPAQTAPPVTRLASVTSSDEDVAATAGGWYSRVRDETIASRDNVKQASYSHDTTIEPADDETATAGQAVSRQQPVGRPGQIILEWSRPAAAPVTPPAPTPQHRLIPDFRGTFWR
jgi:hypothetical protein